jgi:hypothetical protein
VHWPLPTLAELRARPPETLTDRERQRMLKLSKSIYQDIENEQRMAKRPPKPVVTNAWGGPPKLS